MYSLRGSTQSASTADKGQLLTTFALESRAAVG